MIVVSLLFFIAGLLFLFRGADLAVEGAKALALRMGLSTLFIGSTIIAFGTSLPELVVTTEALLRGDPAIGMGNILGSNIANIALVLGLCALLRPEIMSITLKNGDMLKNSLLMVAATVIFILLCFRQTLDLLSGIVLLFSFTAILIALPRVEIAPPPPESRDDGPRHPLIVTIAGLFAVILGSHLLLQGALGIARTLSVPEWFIGFTLVAVGTSLPELATSVAAALRDSIGIAIGNILGSNIFNLLFVLGLNSLFFSVPAPDLFALALLLPFSLAVFVLVIRNPGVIRAWGACILSAYLGCIVALSPVL